VELQPSISTRTQGWNGILTATRVHWMTAAATQHATELLCSKSVAFTTLRSYVVLRKVVGSVRVIDP